MSENDGAYIYKAQCVHCGHEFQPRVVYPKQCRMCFKRWPLGMPPEIKVLREKLR